MENIKNKYLNCLKERKAVLKQMKILEANEIVKRYIELNKQNNELKTKEEKLYEQAKIEEYTTCRHIWVMTQTRNSLEGRKDRDWGCVKCGLDTWLANEGHNIWPEAKLMYDTMKKYRCNGGNYLQVKCDLDIATEEYTKIKNVSPNLSDNELSEILEDVLINLERDKNKQKKISLIKINF